MGRPLRIEYAGALYHVTSRGNERRKIFRDDTDRERFLDILCDYHKRYGILIHSYVLMGNHYHLVLETPQGNLLKVMHGLNGGYTGYFNRRHNRSGHLFQGRYKGILVDKDAYLLQLSRYVHLNPVKARVIDRPEGYRWSSYPAYIGEANEEAWVEYSWVLSRFDMDKDRARGKYREFVEAGLKTKLEDPFEDLYGQVVLGGEEFIDKVKGLLKGKRMGTEIAQRRRLGESPQPATVIKAVAKAFKVTEERITAKGKRDGTARKVALYLVQRYSGLSNDEIGELFGAIHYSAVSKAAARLREEMKRNKELSERVGALDSKFKA